jgi:hypothetical protein
MGPNEHRCAEGRVIFRAGQWFAEMTYRLNGAEGGDLAKPQRWEAGRFKRPRNAMIALEDRVTELRRRHAEAVVFLEWPRRLGGTSRRGPRLKGRLLAAGQLAPDGLAGDEIAAPDD